MKDEVRRQKTPSFLLDNAERIALRADSLTFSLAQTTDEILQAYKLVYRNYRRAEYIGTHPSSMRYNVFNALPQTATVVAKLKDMVVTTASIVFDSPLGLPLETIYQDEVDALRREGATVCEVTMLADRRRGGIRTIPSLLHVFKMILHYVRASGSATDILITVNPSHEVFYTRYLPFDDFGGLRYYPSVNNAPAVARRANVQRLFEEHKNHKLYDFFTENPIPAEIFDAKKTFTAEELREFFVVGRSVLPELPEFAVDYIKTCYPGYDFAKILAPVEK
ncbi:MAG: hypothetical protein J7M19_00120 [Planctomycetes bacterium]|nr:hypothetical protein [Planctomycetota bacterium]